jgi:hypothetical protein
MNDLDKTINAENKRVKYGGGDYKTLSQKAKDESLYLVQKQHIRFVEAIAKCGYRQADIRVPEEKEYGYIPIVK